MLGVADRRCAGTGRGRGGGRPRTVLLAVPGKAAAAKPSAARPAAPAAAPVKLTREQVSAVADDDYDDDDA